MTSREFPDRELSSLVMLLSYATIDFDKAIQILERVVRTDKKLVAVYPGIEQIDTTGMEYIGSIIDGALYIK